MNLKICCVFVAFGRFFSFCCLEDFFVPIPLVFRAELRKTFRFSSSDLMCSFYSDLKLWKSDILERFEDRYTHVAVPSNPLQKKLIFCQLFSDFFLCPISNNWIHDCTKYELTCKLVLDFSKWPLILILSNYYLIKNDKNNKNTFHIMIFLLVLLQNISPEQDLVSVTKISMQHNSLNQICLPVLRC